MPVGQTTTVNVFVSTDQAMNAASGIVSFPSATLEVVSVSKTNSIATLWIQDPSFSNIAGTVSFEGVVLNPGFTGASGRFITITFRGKSEGTAPLSFLSGSVLANDGQGTELLTGTSGANIVVTQRTTLPPAPTPAPAPTAAPVEEKEPAADLGLESPIVTYFTAQVSLGKVAEISGSSVYPGALARITLKGPGEAQILEAPVGQNGLFSSTLVHTLPPGDYSVSVVIMKNGAESPPAKSFVITFKDKSLLARILEFFTQPAVAFLLGVIVAFLLGMASVRFFFGVERRSDKTVHRMLHNIDVEVHKAFLELRSEINSAIEGLEKESEDRELTKSEREFIHKMTGAIKETEKTIDKDVQSGGK